MGSQIASDPQIANDIVTIVLLGLIAVLVVVPCFLMLLLRVSRPPFQIASFRWLYVAWTCLLVGASVWNFSRVPRYSMSEAGADIYVRLAFLMLGVLVILAIGARYRFAFFSELTNGALGIFFLFSLWGFATTLWSVVPSSTLIKSFEYSSILALLALAVSLLNITIRDPQSRWVALKSVFDFGWSIVFLLIVSVYVGIIFWPELAIVQAWRDEVGMVGFSIEGIMPGINGNEIGQLGATLCIVALVRLLLKPGSKVFYVSIFAVGLFTMVLTQSRSPILGFAVAAAAVLIASRRFGLLTLFGGLVSIIVLSGIGQAVYDLVYEFMRRGQSEKDLASLTGRVPYWIASLEAFRDRPFGGYGANAGGRYVLQQVLFEERSTVHSTWVEVLLDTGLVGLILFLMGLVATWYLLFRFHRIATRNPIGHMLWLESLGVLTLVCVRSVFSVQFVWTWELLFLGLVLVFVGVARRQVAQAEHAGAHSAQLLPATRWRRSSIRSRE